MRRSKMNDKSNNQYTYNIDISLLMIFKLINFAYT